MLQLKTHHFKYTTQWFPRLGAFLLLILFSGAILAEALHHHEQDNLNHNKQTQSKHTTQLNAGKINCKFCEIVKHQYHFYTLPDPAIDILKDGEPKETTFIYHLGHSVAYILSASNKGPPVLTA